MRKKKTNSNSLTEYLKVMTDAVLEEMTKVLARCTVSDESAEDGSVCLEAPDGKLIVPFIEFGVQTKENYDEMNRESEEPQEIKLN